MARRESFHIRSRRAEVRLFKTLLVPVDVTEAETAMPAIERAGAMVAQSNGSVCLIYVISIVPMNYRVCDARFPR